MTYLDSLKEFFAHHTLPVVTCSEFLIPDMLRKFHEEARQQQQNLRAIVQRAFTQDRTIDLQKVVLEPSRCWAFRDVWICFSRTSAS